MSFISALKNIFSSKPSTKFPNVVVGKIIDIELHPNADRLRIAVVDVGQIQRIVCGAPNIEPGQLVPVALLGASLPNGTTIKEAVIRGVPSSGMLCAEDELGLGTDHSGIKILKGGTVGEPIDAYL